MYESRLFVTCHECRNIRWQGLLGLVPGEDGDEAEANNEKLDYTNEMERGARAGASLMLVNILAWLRLPPRSRYFVLLFRRCNLQSTPSFLLLVYVTTPSVCFYCGMEYRMK